MSWLSKSMRIKSSETALKVGYILLWSVTRNQTVVKPAGTCILHFPWLILPSLAMAQPDSTSTCSFHNSQHSQGHKAWLAATVSCLCFPQPSLPSCLDLGLFLGQKEGMECLAKGKGSRVSYSVFSCYLDSCSSPQHCLSNICSKEKPNSAEPQPGELSS